jgi:hypothetical protein
MPLLSRFSMNAITTLSEVFQKYLSWDKRRCDFAASYIIAALKVCTVNGIKIAHALDGKSKKKSKYRRLQRFFAEFSFRGFHLETTHLNDPARLWRLFALLAIALLWAYQCGLFLMEKKAITVRKAWAISAFYYCIWASRTSAFFTQLTTLQASDHQLSRTFVMYIAPRHKSFTASAPHSSAKAASNLDCQESSPPVFPCFLGATLGEMNTNRNRHLSLSVRLW